MAQKTPEQIDAEIERLREQRREAEQRRRQQQERAIVRAAERAGILRQHWTSRDLETAMRALARDGLAALREHDARDTDQSAGEHASGAGADAHAATLRQPD